MIDVRPELRCEPGDQHKTGTDTLFPTLVTVCAHPKCGRRWYSDAPPSVYVCGRFPDQAAARFWANLRRREEALR